MKIFFTLLIMIVAVSMNAFAQNVKQELKEIDDGLLMNKEVNTYFSGAVYIFKSDTVKTSYENLKAYPANLVCDDMGGAVLHYDDGNATTLNLNSGGDNKNGCKKLFDGNRNNWCLVDNLSLSGLWK